MGPVSESLDRVVLQSFARVRVGDMVGNDQHAAGSEQIHLAHQESRGIIDVMDDISRDRSVKWSGGNRIKDRLPCEAGPIAETFATDPGSGDHLLREVDPEDAVARFQKGTTHQTRSAACVKNQRVRRKVGFVHKSLQSHRIGLNGGILESRGLAIKSVGQITIMR